MIHRTIRYTNLRRLGSSLLLLTLALALAGCLSIGKEFRPEAVNQIKSGQTRDKDILEIFGNPVRTGVAEDGSREWTYAYYKANAFSAFQGRDLVVKFDSDGKVTSFAYHTTDPSEAIVKPK